MALETREPLRIYLHHIPATLQLFHGLKVQEDLKSQHGSYDLTTIYILVMITQGQTDHQPVYEARYQALRLFALRYSKIIQPILNIPIKVYHHVPNSILLYA
jgi:hypothetical protein